MTYEGTVLSDRLQERLLADVVELAGVGGPDQQIAAPVRVQNGVSNAGKPMHFYMNYSSESQSFTYPHADGTDLLTKKPKAVWFQSGIRHDGAAERLAREGIEVVQDRCLMVELRYLA